MDAAAEDMVLLGNWLAGPGARPTPADRERWASADTAGRTVSRMEPTENQTPAPQVHRPDGSPALNLSPSLPELIDATAKRLHEEVAGSGAGEECQKLAVTLGILLDKQGNQENLFVRSLRGENRRLKEELAEVKRSAGQS